jgi:hypothetical protein
MTWQLSTYERNGTIGLAVLRADGSLAGPPELKRWPTTMELLADWDQAEPVLRGLEVAGAPAVEYDRLLAPLRWPRKVLCAGVNYRRHMREMGVEIPEQGWRPFFFLKTPSTTIIGPADPIVDRDPERSRLDWRPNWPWSSAPAAGTSPPATPSGTWPATAWPTTSPPAACTGGRT